MVSDVGRAYIYTHSSTNSGMNSTRLWERHAYFLPYAGRGAAIGRSMQYFKASNNYIFKRLYLEESRAHFEVLPFASMVVATGRGIQYIKVSNTAIFLSYYTMRAWSRHLRVLYVGGLA